MKSGAASKFLRKARQLHSAFIACVLLVSISPSAAFATGTWDREGRVIVRNGTIHIFNRKTTYQTRFNTANGVFALKTGFIDGKCYNFAVRVGGHTPTLSSCDRIQNVHVAQYRGAKSQDIYRQFFQQRAVDVSFAYNGLISRNKIGAMGFQAEMAALETGAAPPQKEVQSAPSKHSVEETSPIDMVEHIDERYTQSGKIDMTTPLTDDYRNTRVSKTEPADPQIGTNSFVLAPPGQNIRLAENSASSHDDEETAPSTALDLAAPATEAQTADPLINEAAPKSEIIATDFLAEMAALGYEVPQEKETYTSSPIYTGPLPGCIKIKWSEVSSQIFLHAKNSCRKIIIIRYGPHDSNNNQHTRSLGMKYGYAQIIPASTTHQKRFLTSIRTHRYSHNVIPLPQYDLIIDWCFTTVKNDEYKKSQLTYHQDGCVKYMTADFAKNYGCKWKVGGFEQILCQK